MHCTPATRSPHTSGLFQSRCDWIYEFLWGLRSWVFSSQVIPHFSFDVIHGHHSSWSQVDSVLWVLFSLTQPGNGDCKRLVTMDVRQTCTGFKKKKNTYISPEALLRTPHICTPSERRAGTSQTVKENMRSSETCWQTSSTGGGGKKITLKLKGCLFGSAPWT